jgi:hypothetical protein
MRSALLGRIEQSLSHRVDGAVASRRDEGLLLSARIGAFYLAYCVAVVVCLIYPRWMDWASVDLSPLRRWIGA